MRLQSEALFQKGLSKTLPCFTVPECYSGLGVAGTGNTALIIVDATAIGAELVLSYCPKVSD